MRRFILTPKRFSAVVFGVVLFVAAQVALHSVVQDYTKIYQGPCAFQSWSKDGNNVRLDLLCNGGKGSTTDIDVVVAYLAKPEGQLTCSLFAGGNASCEVPR
ncbi:MAG: hypothetical protein Q7R48_03610 [bacterium]|nr:hypothetical protein [bacterium]